MHGRAAAPRDQCPAHRPPRRFDGRPISPNVIHSVVSLSMDVSSISGLLTTALHACGGGRLTRAPCVVRVLLLWDTVLEVDLLGERMYFRFLQILSVSQKAVTVLTPPAV